VGGDLTRLAVEVLGGDLFLLEDLEEALEGSLGDAELLREGLKTLLRDPVDVANMDAATGRDVLELNGERSRPPLSRRHAFLVFRLRAGRHARR
jgi:hypothetical protein